MYSLVYETPFLRTLPTDVLPIDALPIGYLRKDVVNKGQIKEDAPFPGFEELWVKHKVSTKFVIPPITNV